MSMPAELFQKYYQEYDTKIQSQTKKLIQIRSQSQQKQRESKLNQLTLNELSQYDCKCYKTVGKMFQLSDLKIVKQELKDKIQDAEKELEVMGKLGAQLDSDLQDAKRNLNSLIEKYQGKQ